jgi:thiamine phosphate synthase YjbQ (UPF0047 family)
MLQTVHEWFVPTAMLREFIVPTHKHRDFVDVTRQVQALVHAAKVRDGR